MHSTKETQSTMDSNELTESYAPGMSDSLERREWIESGWTHLQAYFQVESHGHSKGREGMQFLI